MTVQWTPRWRHQKLSVDQSSTIRPRPSLFSNDSPWNWHLKWLSLAGVPVTAAAPFDDTQAPIGRRFEIEISITQKSDVNYARANVGTIFAGHTVPYQGSATYFFNPIVEIPPDTGIVAEISFADPTSERTLINPAIVFNGTRLERNLGVRPAQLASYEDVNLGYQEAVTFGEQELFNNGEEPLYLHNMVLPGALEGGSNLDYYISQTLIRINPTTGVPWMPDNSMIPIGCVCPHSSYSNPAAPAGAEYYKFPQGTILRPRQKLSVELENLTAAAQPNVNFCLHGYLEVK